MNEVAIVERPMSDGEYATTIRGFNEHTVLFGNPVETEERFGYVALDNGSFIGCSSCLAYKSPEGYGKWCFLTDLYLEPNHRRKGIGAQLLQFLENKMRRVGILYIYTWTAGYEAPAFYVKQGYTQFAELSDWYASGHSRVGYKKNLSVK